MFISDAISIMILLSVNTTEAGNNSRSGNAQSSYKYYYHRKSNNEASNSKSLIIPGRQVSKIQKYKIFNLKINKVSLDLFGSRKYFKAIESQYMLLLLLV